MRFNIYRRFQIEVNREGGSWAVYRLELGRRTKMDDVVIPAGMEAGAIATYLDDLLHELSGPGDRIETID
jgi:hypothetical protein